MTSGSDTLETLQADNAALRERIAALEQQLHTAQPEQMLQPAPEQLLQAVIDAIPFAVYWKNTELVYQGCNQRFANDVQLATTHDIVGKTDADLIWRPEEIEQFRAIDRQVIATNTSRYDTDDTTVHRDGTQEWFETFKIPIHDTHEHIVGVLGIYNNITARKQSEELARQAVGQKAIIAAQQAALRELSTPLIPIMDGVVAMPLIGTIDSARAQQIMETLLEGISAQQAEIAILDITGVHIVDTQVANALVRTAQAVQLLGARVVLTGMRAEVAQAIVHLGVDLHNITTRSNLQGGIRYAFEQVHAQG